MKSIRKELLRNNLILILCACVFIGYNMISHMTSVVQNNSLLAEYQQIHNLVLVNDQRKTSFKLYCKSHEESLLQSYYEDCRLLDQRLEELSGKMQQDNNCKMMFRLVCQVVEHSKTVADQYTNPADLYNPGTLNYLDEVNLELDRCLNMLINYYLEYLNRTFSQKSEQKQQLAILMNVVLIFGYCCILKQSRDINDSILESIETLSGAATEITHQNFDSEDIGEMEFAELNQVSGTFNHMKHTIRNMIVEINEKHQMKEHLAEAKIRELQMQMNPHFLFNTLNLVVRNIQIGEKDTSIQLIRSISRILRSSIEIKALAIPLDDEIDLLQAYLYIQKLHLRGRVTFYLDVRKSFVDVDKEFKIPPLTLQPLVENSVQHGLKDKVRDGKVEILITEKADYMEVVVADNGSGFHTQELLLPDAEPPADKNGGVSKTSIGLKNVRERLKLYYRKDDVMKIDRVDGVTRITLKLYKTREC